MTKIQILRPTIFPSNINAGVTLANYNIFPNGFNAFNELGLNYGELNINRKILANNIGLKIENLIFQKQVHSTHIQIITGDYIFNNSLQTLINEGDGYVTMKRQIALCIGLADCGGILLYDPVQNIIGAFHSGWKGTVANIVKVGIDTMKQVTSSNPNDIFAYITPCAGRDNYEVEYDVAQYFPNYTKLIEDNKYLLDIKGAIYSQLINEGVEPQNIEVSSICTIANKNYHSFRRDGDKSGRMTAFIYIKSRSVSTS